ncbi:hypothetical protein NQ318_006008 [Aromia moschata]|uniref:Uncharacterized protein n=1 Tax=Aromia moschata TaxID=1265417 RepID=A0AAV8Y0P7_9CUCU|nr:hypothetical protein NQ318_006008 [Aromia moschata]
MYTQLQVYSTLCNPKSGAIFDAEDEEQRATSIRAFEAAVSDVNNGDYDFQFKPIVTTIDYDNSYQAMTETCSLLENGVIGIFGPLSEENSNVIQSICDLKEIPHIEVRWDDRPQNGTIVSIYPYPDILTRTYINIIDSWKWTDFVILYENNESFQRVGELLKSFSPSKHRIVVRQLGPMEDYRPMLKELWKSGATHFVVDCSIEILGDVLQQAQQIGLMTNLQHYIITNLDLHTLNLVPYQFAETNITGMIFVDLYDEELIRVAKQIRPECEDLAGGKLRLEEALTYDAIMMFAEAIKAASPIKPIGSMSCHDGTEIFSSGTSLINFMRTLEYKGLTGRVKFDITGFRTNFGLDIIELKEETPVDNKDDISNTSFIVITTLTEPYGMEKASSENLQGNDRYEGFAIDLIHELSVMKGFNYTIIIREDKKNGAPDSNGKWTGMLGDLMDEKADLAITDLTITYQREEAVDFTSPFMTLGISILYQKPTKAPPSFFSFADPFAAEVWKLLMVGCVGVSVILFVLGRISPTQWENPYPCIEEPEYLVNQIDLRNSFWFMTGAILQQGSEIELKKQ